MYRRAFKIQYRYEAGIRCTYNPARALVADLDEIPRKNDRSGIDKRVLWLVVWVVEEISVGRGDKHVVGSVGQLAM